MKKGLNLLDKTKLLALHPELHDLFSSTAALYRKVIFSKRMELGHTQAELATKANVGLATIASAEGGSGTITLNELDDIFKALNLLPKDVATMMIELSSEQ